MPLPVSPPVTSTRPSLKSVAVCPDRAEFMGAATVKTPLVSNRSALAVGPVVSEPPEMRTLPSWRSTAAAPERTSPRGFQDCQEPAGTLGTDAVRKNTHSRTKTDVAKILLTMRKWVLRTELSVSPKQSFPGYRNDLLKGGPTGETIRPREYLQREGQTGWEMPPSKTFPFHHLGSPTSQAPKADERTLLFPARDWLFGLPPTGSRAPSSTWNLD